MSEVLTRSEFEARMRERHRPAFELWRRCHEMLESVVCTAQGFFLEHRGDVVEVRTTGPLVRAILIFGTRYMLEIAQAWREHFGLLDEPVLAAIADQACNFDGKQEIVPTSRSKVSHQWENNDAESRRCGASVYSAE